MKRTQSLITCSPYFIDMALVELRRAHPDLSLIRELSTGHLIVQSGGAFADLTAPWRNRLPIYLHHAFPIQGSVPLQAVAADLDRIAAAWAGCDLSDLTVQVRSESERLPYTPADVHQRLTGNPPAYTYDAPTGRILSVLLTDDAASMGMSQAAHNLSPWAGGQIPISEPVSNRAGYKLLEALQAFAIHLRKGGHALDLGAAPGAWTTLLRKRGMRVTAVAPTPMYPWLTLDPDVVLHPTTAEDYLGRCADSFDLMVNDMWLDARDSARLMVDYAEHLRPNGIAIMTLKLTMKNKQRLMDHAYRILRKRYRIIRVRQLVSNRHEVTLYLRRKE